MPWRPSVATLSPLDRSGRPLSPAAPARGHEEQADQCGPEPVFIARRRPTSLEDQLGVEVRSGQGPEHGKHLILRQPGLESAATPQKHRDVSLLAEPPVLAVVITCVACGWAYPAQLNGAENALLPSFLKVMSNALIFARVGLATVNVVFDGWKTPTS